MALEDANDSVLFRVACEKATLEAIAKYDLTEVETSSTFHYELCVFRKPRSGRAFVVSWERKPDRYADCRLLYRPKTQVSAATSELRPIALFDFCKGVAGVDVLSYENDVDSVLDLEPMLARCTSALVAYCGPFFSGDFASVEAALRARDERIGAVDN